MALRADQEKQVVLYDGATVHRTDGVSVPLGSGFPAPQFSSSQTGTVSGVANQYALLNLSGTAGVFTFPKAPADGSLCGFKVASYTTGTLLTLNTQGSDVFDTGTSTSTPSVVKGLSKIYRYTSATATWVPLAGDAPELISSATTGLVGTTSSVLITGAAITTLPVSGFAGITQVAAGVTSSTIPFRIVANDGSGKSDPIIATSTVAAGATSVPVSNYTPSYPFPQGSAIYAQPSLMLPSVSTDSRYLQPRGGRLCGFGASFANGTGANSSNSPQNGTFGSGFITKVCALSNGLLRPVANISINAGTDGSAENLAKIGQLLGANADIVLLDSGWMDHDNGAWGRTPAQQCANMLTFVQICRAWGITPILTSLPPKGPGISYSEAEWQASNIFAQNFAVQNNVLYIDVMSPMTTGSGSNWSSAYLAGDNQHPNEQGHMEIATLVVNAMTNAGQMPHCPHWLPNSSTDPNNLLGDGVWPTASGSTAPTGWTAGGSSSVATLSYSSVTGVYAAPGQVLTISRSSNDGTKYIQKNITTGFSVGDVVAFVGQGQFLTVQNSVSSFLPQATFTGATGSLPPSISPLGSPGADFTAPFTWYMQAVVPPGTTGILVRCTLNNGTSAVAASVGFNRVGVVDLTTTGIAY